MVHCKILNVVVVFVGFAEFARVAGVGDEASKPSPLADVAGWACVGVAVCSCFARFAAVADGSDAEQASEGKTDRVAACAVFCVGEGAVVDWAGVASGALVVGKVAVQAGEGVAIAGTTLAIFGVCNGAVGGRAVDRGSFVAGAGVADTVEA